MSIGAVLDEPWNLFTRFFPRFFVIVLVVLATTNLQAHADTDRAATGSLRCSGSSRRVDRA